MPSPNQIPQTRKRFEMTRHSSRPKILAARRHGHAFTSRVIENRQSSCHLLQYWVNEGRQAVTRNELSQNWNLPLLPGRHFRNESRQSFFALYNIFIVYLNKSKVLIVVKVEVTKFCYSLVYIKIQYIYIPIPIYKK